MIDILAMEEQFTGDYKQAFSKISMYGTMTPLDKDKYEDRILNIYDVLMAAQQDGRPVEKIVGNDIEVFCRKYYKNQDTSEWIGNIFNRIFRVMLVLAVYSALELILGFADIESFEDFIHMEVNAAPLLVGILVGLIIIGIENVVKHKIVLKTDKIKNGVYAVGTLVIFFICITVGVVLFSDLDAKMPLWIMLAISCGYSVVYVVLCGIIRYKKNGTLKNIDRVDKQEIKEFNKEVALEYGIKTSAEAMVERFDKMKKKYAKKGKPEPDFAEFSKEIRKEHKNAKYIEIFFTIFIFGMGVFNIATSIGSEEMILEIIVAIITVAVTLVVFRFAMNAIKEVEEEQCIILDECEKKEIDIYQYVANM